MPHPSWPNAGDLRKFLGTTGADADTLAALDCALGDAAAAAQARIERATDVRFVADANASVRYYAAPQNTNVLQIHECISVTSVVYQPVGSTAQTLTLNDDYFLQPDNYAALGEPIMAIVFPGRRWSSPLTGPLLRAIQVTARWGRGTTLPGDVWMAALQSGALWLWSNYQMAFTGGLESYKEADVSEEYGNSASSPWAQAVTRWSAQVAAVEARYRSPRMYF